MAQPYAHAQTAPPPAQPAPSAATTSPPSGASASDATAQANDAKALYDHALSLYALGRYAEAAPLFEKAFELKPIPALSYNAAQAHRFAGHGPATGNCGTTVTLYSDKSCTMNAGSFAATGTNDINCSVAGPYLSGKINVSPTTGACAAGGGATETGTLGGMGQQTLCCTP